MAYKSSPRIQFDTPPTIAELIEGLEDLRAMAGPDAVVRVMGVIEIDIVNGPRIAAISAART